MKVLHYIFAALCATCIACALIAGATHQLAMAGICALMAAATNGKEEEGK